MTKLIISILAAVVLSGCSPSSSDTSAGGGRGGVTEKAAAGTWISECTESAQGSFIEKMTMQNGSGASTLEFMQNQDCSGGVVRIDGPNNFQYSLGSTTGNTTQVTITGQGQPAVQGTVVFDGAAMSLTANGRTMKYSKVVQQIPQAPTPNGSDFDSVAKGTWVTRECGAAENNQSYKLLITFKGNGQGSMVYKLFQNPTCAGTAQDVGAADFTYIVDRYSNGGGQITIDSQPSDVTFQGNTMTTSSEQGTSVFEKIN